MFRDYGFGLAGGLLHGHALTRGKETQRDGSQAQLEKPVSTWTREVVMPFRLRTGDHADLGVIEAEIHVELPASGGGCFRVWKQDAGRTAFDDDVPVCGVVQLRQALCDQHYRGVLLT